MRHNIKRALTHHGPQAAFGKSPAHGSGIGACKRLAGLGLTLCRIHGNYHSFDLTARSTHDSLDHTCGRSHKSDRRIIFVVKQRRTDADHIAFLDVKFRHKSRKIVRHYGHTAHTGLSDGLLRGQATFKIKV